jgi:hypothetical protein
MQPDLRLRVPPAPPWPCRWWQRAVMRIDDAKISYPSSSTWSGAAMLLLLSRPVVVARARARRRGGCAAALLLAGRGGGGRGVRRCGARLILLEEVLDALAVSFSSSTWLHGGGKALAELEICFVSGVSGSFSPAAGSVALPRIHDVGHPLPPLLADLASLLLSHPKWPVPRRWCGGQSSAAASVAWSRAQGPDRVLARMQGPFYTFAGCVCNFIFFRGLPAFV